MKSAANVAWCEILPWGSYGRTWCNPSCPSCSCSRRTRPSSWSTGCPCSWCGRTPWSNLSPPCRSGTCSGRRTCLGSRSCTHRNDPGSSSPRRRWSEERRDKRLGERMRGTRGTHEEHTSHVFRTKAKHVEFLAVKRKNNVQWRVMSC